MARVERFAFATDFASAGSHAAQASAAASIASAAERMLAEQDAMLSAARADVFEAGIAHARSLREARDSDALRAIVTALAAIAERQDKSADESTRAAALLAVAAATQLAARALAAEPLERLRAELPQLVAAHIDSPRLIVRVPPEQTAQAQSLLSDCAAAAHFVGRISVEADAALAPGDAEVAWRGGGWRTSLADRRAALAHSIAKMLPEGDHSTGDET